MKFEEIESRTPLWMALSELFLDTVLSDDDRKRIAALLKQSPYTLNEIETILYEEVYPVCIPNLLYVAGEWTGFDPEWLKKEILNRQRRKRQRDKNKFQRKRLNQWMINEEWETIKVLMRS